MIGDGSCDSQCNVESCDFDGLDCGCAPGCNRNDYGTCKEECLVAACGYDHMPNSSPCSDLIKVKTAQIYQAVSQDYSGKYVFAAMCTAHSPLCVSYLWQISQATCLPECNTLPCLYSFGNCDIICPSHCSDCAGEICLSCELGWLLFFSECLQSCPDGFASNPDFPGTCVVAETSQLLVYYVSEKRNSLRKGNAANPFQSLSEALSAVQGRNSTIYLLSGFHQLAASLPNPSLYNLGDHALFQSVSSLSGEMSIIGCLCGECSHSDCAEELPVLSLDNLNPSTLVFRGKVTLENIHFLGNSTLLENCQAEMCSYCPLISKAMKDDRGAKVSIGAFAPQALCTAFHSYSLISLVPEATLTLKNTTFTGFRQQFSSLISFTSGYVFLYNVTFVDIVVNVSVISQISVSGYEAGSLEVYGGTVSLLNNGYEYQEEAVFAGFLTIAGLAHIALHWITIEYSVLGIDGAMINVSNFEQIHIAECNFHHIVGRIVVIQSTVDFVVAGDSNITLALYSATHILVENCIFEGVSGASLITVNMSGNLLNTLISSCHFLTCLSTTSGMVSIRLLRSVFPIEQNGGQLAVRQGSDRVQVLVPKSTTRVEGGIWEGCAVAGEGLLGVKGLPNVQIAEVSVKDTKELTVYTATLSSLIGVSGAYISLPAGNTVLSACVSLVQLSKLTTVSVLSSSFTRNKCSTAGIVGASLASASLSALSFTSNISGTSAVAVVLSLILLTSAQIAGLTVVANQSVSASSLGAVLIVAGSGEAAISQCLFQGNKASSGPALSCTGLCTITDSTFIMNSALSGTAGGLVYSPIVSAKQLTLLRCRFLGNSSTYGGALMLYDPAVVANVFQLTIEDSSFESNGSHSYGSCIFLTTTVQLTTSSVIARSKFINNFSVYGCVFVGFKGGVLNITDSLFRNTTSVAYSVLVAQQSPHTDLSPSLVRLINCIVELNSGALIFQLSSASATQYVYAESYNLTYRYNTGRGIMLSQLANWKDYGSAFLNNTSVDAGGAFLSNGISSLQSVGSVFKGNLGTSAASTIYLGEMSQGIVQNALFEENIGKSGAVFYVEQKSILVVLNSKFIRNRSTTQAAVFTFFVGFQVVSQVLTNCSFIENQSDTGAGSIYLESANLTITNCSFTNDHGKPYAEIVSYLAALQITDTVFLRTLPFSGTFVTASAESVLNFRRVEFQGSLQADKGAAIYINSGVLIVRECHFRNLQANMGSAVAIYSGCRYDITDSLFEDVNAGAENGGVLLIFESQGNITTSTFKRYSNGALVASFSQINVADCTFLGKFYADGDNIRGAGLSCSECPSASIARSLFQNLKAQAAPAIQLKVTTIWYFYSIIDCVFDSNRAIYKGAVLLSNVDAHVQGCRFIKNSVGNSDLIEGSGAGMYLECPDRNSGCTVRVESCSFLSNSAKRSGGGIAWADSKPELRDLTFINNTATYGTDIASFPVTLSHASDHSLLSKDVQSVPSGQPSKSTLVVYLLDHYNQIVTVDNVSYANLQPMSPLQASVSGVTRVIAEMGVFTFDDYTITSEPGRTAAIGIYTNAVDISKGDHDTQFSENITIQASMRYCEVGEAQINTYCEICPYGKYSLEVGEACESCPTGAICYGNYTLVPQPGYWRLSATTDVIWECYESAACLGSPEPPEPLSLTGECAKGYFGNLCHGCSAGFSRNGRYVCAKCPEFAINVIRVVGVGIAAVLIVILIIKTSLISAHRSRSAYSIYFKIFINYLQLLSATAVFDFKWPSYVLQLLKLQESAGNVSEQVFSFDCFLTDSSADQGKLTYLRVVVVSTLPLLILLSSFVLWSLVSWARHSGMYIKNHMINSIVVLFFLVHPSIVKVMFDVFNCKELDGGLSWLSSNLTIRCWDAQHRRYAMGVALPGILLWGVAVPLLALVRLCMKRRTLDMLETRIHFGFLYNGYRPQRFYWEFIILYRKMLIITIAVFIFNISVAIQALCAMLVLVLAVIFQMREAPYITAVLNTLEQRAIVVAAITVYCGMWFMTGDLGESSKVVMLVIIVVANLYFLILWTVQICKVCAGFVNKLLIALRLKTGLVAISPASNPANSQKLSVSLSGSGEHSVNQSKVSDRQYDDSSEEVNPAFHRAPREPRLSAPDNSVVVAEDSSSFSQK